MVPGGSQHQHDEPAQVIYTRGDGTTAIETWSKGEKVESAEEEAARWASRQQVSRGLATCVASATRSPPP